MKSRMAKQQPQMKHDANFKKTAIPKAAAMMKTLSHPLRLSILCALIEKGEMTEGEIVEMERGRHSQSQVSQYLGALKDSGFVSARRDGQSIWYKIQSPDVQRIIRLLYDIYCG